MSRSLAPGKAATIENYSVTLREKIGEGGYAVVYRCEDAQGHQFALKCVNCVTPEKFDQFQQEAIVLKALPPHPNIVKLHAAEVNKHIFSFKASNNATSPLISAMAVISSSR